MSLIEISPLQLALCAVFVVVAGTGSAVLRLGLEKDLAWGTVRTFAQLFLVGYVLKFIFQLSNPYLVLLVKVLLPAICITTFMFSVVDHACLKVKLYDQLDISFIPKAMNDG